MRSKLLALAAFSLALLLNGCGSGSSSPNNTPAGSAYITLSATSLTFPSTTVGQSSAAQTITVTNTGNATATLTGDTVSDITDFTLTSSACGSTLAANSSCVLSIVFNPKTAGTLTSTVTVTDNATNSPQTVMLSGTATAVVVLVPQATLSLVDHRFPPPPTLARSPLHRALRSPMEATAP